MKKFLCAAVAAVCTVSSFAFFGCSVEPSVNFTLSEGGDYCIVSGVSGKNGLKEYEVPQFCVKEDGTLRPAAEGDDASSLIPVKEIGDEAFNGCSHMTEIKLPDGITRIGNLAFAWCSFKTFNMPESVVEIGYSAFGFCDKLEEIIIPENVEKLGDRAFSRCDSLVRVVIEGKITSLDYNTFNASLFSGADSVYYTSSLKEIYLPATLQKIHITAFRNCAMLTDVYFAGSEEEWKQVYFYEMAKKENSEEYEEKRVEEDRRKDVDELFVAESTRVKVKMHYNKTYVPAAE